MANEKMIYSVSDVEKDYDQTGQGVECARENGGRLH